MGTEPPTPKVAGAGGADGAGLSVPVVAVAAGVTTRVLPPEIMC